MRSHIIPTTGGEPMDMVLRGDFLTSIAEFLAVRLPATVTAAQVPHVTRPRPGRRPVASVERAPGRCPHRPRWGRVAAAAGMGWCFAEPALVGVAPSLAVWAGGAVVTVGAVVPAKVRADPRRLDDHGFDRRLREMLDQG